MADLTRPPGGGKAPLRVAVASGKGGTGKTLVATNLAWTAAAAGRAVTYVDCDVEEPDGAIFLAPEIVERRLVLRSVPRVESVLCTRCGRCATICQFNAIAPVGGRVLVFPELCKSCGGCAAVCQSGAITESTRDVGRVGVGASGTLAFVQGVLDVGETSTTHVIRAAKEAAPASDLVILDAPPGTACPAVETIRDADLVLLVTEPTPFGLNDLRLAVALARELKLQFAVVVNRVGIGTHDVWTFCKREEIPVVAELPDDRAIAETYARGRLVAESNSEFRNSMIALLEKLSARDLECALS